MLFNMHLSLLMSLDFFRLCEQKGLPKRGWICQRDMSTWRVFFFQRLGSGVSPVADSIHFHPSGKHRFQLQMAPPWLCGPRRVGGCGATPPCRLCHFGFSPYCFENWMIWIFKTYQYLYTQHIFGIVWMFLLRFGCSICSIYVHPPMPNSKPSECQRPIAGHRVASPSAALSPGAPCFAGPDREPRFCPPSRGTQRRGVERKPSGNQRWQLNIHHKWLKTMFFSSKWEKKTSWRLTSLTDHDGPVPTGSGGKIPWENPAGAGMLPRQQIAGPAERGSGLRFSRSAPSDFPGPAASTTQPTQQPDGAFRKQSHLYSS